MDRKLVTLVIIMGLLLLTLAVLLGIAIGAGAYGGLELLHDSLSSWVTAIATSVIAVLTIILAKETWELRNIQLNQIEQIRKDAIRPNIAIALKDSRAGISFMNIHVINNGTGTAQNIRFRFTNEDPSAADIYGYMCDRIEEIAFLSDGISSLSSGQEMSSFFLNFIEMNGKFPNDHAFDLHFTVKILCEDSEGDKFETRTAFRLNELKGITQLGDDPAKKASSSLEKIQKDLHQLALGTRRLRTDIYSSVDRERERKQREEERAEMIKARRDES